MRLYGVSKYGDQIDYIFENFEDAKKMYPTELIYFTDSKEININSIQGVVESNPDWCVYEGKISSEEDYYLIDGVYYNSCSDDFPEEFYIKELDNEKLKKYPFGTLCKVYDKGIVVNHVFEKY